MAPDLNGTAITTILANVFTIEVEHYCIGLKLLCAGFYSNVVGHLICCLLIDPLLAC